MRNSLYGVSLWVVNAVDGDVDGSLVFVSGDHAGEGGANQGDDGDDGLHFGFFNVEDVIELNEDEM